jgi:hypothetical protein
MDVCEALLFMDREIEIQDVVCRTLTFCIKW